MSDGDKLPKFCLKEITVVGIICKLVEAKTKSVHEPSKSPLLQSRVVAFIPDGVAMPPSPSVLALTFIAICFFVFSSAFLKSLDIIGSKSFVNLSTKPESSAILRSPDQTA
jgi:hypothetical protein